MIYNTSWASIFIDISNVQKQNITSQTFIFKDKNTNRTPLEIETILPKEPYNKPTIKHLQTFSKFWFKFTLANNSSTKISRYLIFKAMFPGTINYYEKKNGKWIKKYQFGSSVPVNDKPINSLRAAIPIQFNNNEVKEIMLERKALHSLGASIIIEDIYHFHKAESKKKSIILFFLGVILVVLFINILLFYFYRKLLQFSYILFILGFTFFLLNMNGIIDMLYWGISPSIKHYSVAYSCIQVLFVLYFMVNLFGITKKEHWIYRIAYIPMIISLVMIILYFLGIDNILYYPSGRYVDKLIIFSIPIVILISLKGLKDRLESARYFIFAIISFVAPIIHWFSVLYFFNGNHLDPEIPFLIGALLCFCILNVRTFIIFRNFSESNHISLTEAKIGENYQNTLRMLSHDLATPLMTIKACIKKITRLNPTEQITALVKKVSNSEKELERILSKVRVQEKETSDIALDIEIVRTNLLAIIKQSIHTSTSETFERSIQMDVDSETTILSNTALLSEKILFPIFRFIYNSMQEGDNLFIKSTHFDQYINLSISYYGENEIIRILPNFHKEIENHFNIELVTNLGLINQIISSNKLLNAMGSSIEIKNTENEIGGTEFIIRFAI